MENSDPNNSEVTTNYGESQILNNNQSQLSHNQPQQSLSFKETLYLQQHLLQSGNQQILIQNQITGIHQGQNQYQKYEQNHQIYQQQSNQFQNQYEHHQEYGRHNLDSNYNNNQYENYNQQNYGNQFEHENNEQKMVDQENQYQENQTQTFEQFRDVQQEGYIEHQENQNHNNQQELQLNQNQLPQQRHLQIEQPVPSSLNTQIDAKLPLPSKQQHIKQVDNSSVSFNQFTVYQNQILEEMKQKQIKQVKKSESVEQKKQPINQKQQNSSQNIKKSKKKKKKDQGQPLPVISANSQQGKKQIMSEKKIQQKKIVSFDPPKKQTNPQIKKVSSTNPSSDSEPNKIKKTSSPNPPNPSDESEPKKKPSPIKQQRMSKQQPSIVLNKNISQPQEQVSQIINPTSASAGVIIFEAQRQRIASTLQYFLKFVSKHQKHTTNQKQIITNIEQEMQKKRISKQLIANALKDYFNDVESMCKQFYQKSYKYVKNQKIINPNAMINMREQLKTGYDQMIFLRKSSGNDFHRIGDFINSTIQRNIVKTFTQYWNAVSNAQNKNKQKKQDFYKKQKELSKRISKVQKVYSKGKQGISQQEDLFIQMTKYINQEKQYRKSLIQYGLGLIPMKKAFIKAEQTLYEQLQAIFNSYKNQCKSLFAMHPKQFTQIQKYQKLVKQKNTFQKLSDITDGDYVRSVLVAVQKTSIQNLTDKDFQKVFNMVHFQQIVGSPIELLKGTTSKSFQLKNKSEQVVDTISGNLLIFNKQTAQMKQKFVIKNINAKIVQQGVVEIEEVLKGFLFDSNRTFRITFRDNDRAEQLICFLNQLQESIETALQQNKK